LLLRDKVLTKNGAKTCLLSDAVSVCLSVCCGVPCAV
jgi:hypothetical protein